MPQASTEFVRSEHRYPFVVFVHGVVVGGSSPGNLYPCWRRSARIQGVFGLLRQSFVALASEAHLLTSPRCARSLVFHEYRAVTCFDPQIVGASQPSVDGAAVWVGVTELERRPQAM